MQKYEKLEKIGEGTRKHLTHSCTDILQMCDDNLLDFGKSEVFHFQNARLNLLLLLGTYGTVFKAKNRETLEIVAMKRVRLDDDDEVFNQVFNSFNLCTR